MSLSEISGLDYPAWARLHDQPNEADYTAMAAHIRSLSKSVKFLMVPLIRAGDTPWTWLPVIQALRSQIYPQWAVVLPRQWTGLRAGAIEAAHFLLIDMPSPETEGERRTFLASAIAQFETAEVDFVIPLLPGALLDRRALYEFAAAAAETPVPLILYADEDQVDQTNGTRFAPRLKTGFDPELMLGRDALGHPVVFERALLARLAGLREGVGPIGVALHDLALRACELAPPGRVRHVPVVLCHRAAPAGIAPEWDATAARQVIRSYLERTGEAGTLVHPAPLAPAWCRLERRLPEEPPLVSVIIPTRDNAGMLKRCLDGLLYRTDYPALEVLIVDNGSTASDALALLAALEPNPRVRLLRRPGPFNYSALNNMAARLAKGEVLLLLNNDTDVLSPSWLGEMVAHAIRPDVGAVGTKLLYPDGRVQHAGVVLGNPTMITHQLRLSARDDPGPQGELALARTVLAVTAACLALRKSVFWEVGGLDEANLAVAFNDVDLCLRLQDHGYRVVWTPFAEMLHLESASRGPDSGDPIRVARAQREFAVVSNRWAPDMRVDLFHNPNIIYGWDEWGLASPPRRTSSWTSHQ